MMAWIVSPARCIRLITANVPTLKRSAKVGASISWLRWAMITRVFSSLANAASSTALDSVRFTEMGMTCDGNSTLVRNGSTGYVIA